MNNIKIDLLNLDTNELTGLLASWGQPGYRVKQLQQWIYRELVDNFDAMSNLPTALRARLNEETTLGTLEPIAVIDSKDNLTEKALFRMANGQTVETVLMRYLDAPGSPEDAIDPPNIARRTVCISTQVGCPVRCPFCETGQAGFIRNLTLGEIVAQVLHFARHQKAAGYDVLPLTNVVIMGMGEPFMKFNVTSRAMEAFTDPARFGMGARRITVSTSGYVDGIQQLADKHPQVNLAVSLHTANDALRDRLVPVNKKYPLAELMRACREYVRLTHRRITFEYALMDGINDSVEQAEQVAELLGGLLCHVNLIPLNPTSESPYQRTPYSRVKQFEQTLRDAGIPTTLRVEKGIEIAAGCGQLRQQLAKRSPQVADIPLAL